MLCVQTVKRCENNYCHAECIKREIQRSINATVFRLCSFQCISGVKESNSKRLKDPVAPVAYSVHPSLFNTYLIHLNISWTLGGLQPIKYLLLKVTGHTSEILNIYLFLCVNIHHFPGFIRWSFNELPIRPSGKLVLFKASITIFGEVETIVYINASEVCIYLRACVHIEKCVGLVLHFPPFPSHKASVTCHWITIFLPLLPCKKYQPKINCQRVAQMKEYEVEILCLSVCVCVCVCVRVRVCKRPTLRLFVPMCHSAVCLCSYLAVMVAPMSKHTSTRAHADTYLIPSPISV